MIFQREGVMSWEGLNRRKFPRAKFPCLIKIVKAGTPGDAILTHTENISTGGVCVIIKKQLETFSTVGIEIDLMDGEDIITAEAKVVWIVRRKATEDVKPSFYDTGVEFVSLPEHLRLRLEATVNHLLRVDGSVHVA
jgi:c-di-GMP-binding flagellar brake protein YcgR